jgi:hypothetical protein
MVSDGYPLRFDFQSICADSFEFLVQCSCIEDKYYEEYKNSLGCFFYLSL